MEMGKLVFQVLSVCFFLLAQMFASSLILLFSHPSRDKDAADKFIKSWEFSITPPNWIIRKGRISNVEREMGR